MGRWFVACLAVSAVVFCGPMVTRAAVVDENSPEFNALMSAYQRGTQLKQQGRYGEAVVEYEKAVSLAPRVFGLGDTNTAALMNNVAALYECLGRYAEAEPLHQRSLKILEKALGPNHPDVAASLNNLAVLYISLGRYEYGNYTGNFCPSVSFDVPSCPVMSPIDRRLARNTAYWLLRRDFRRSRFPPPPVIYRCLQKQGLRSGRVAIRGFAPPEDHPACPFPLRGKRAVPPPSEHSRLASKRFFSGTLARIRGRGETLRLRTGGPASANPAPTEARNLSHLA